MSPEEEGDCPHGRKRFVCFDCLSPEDQQRSREAWAAIEEMVPDLRNRLAEREKEFEAGKVIRMKRPEWSNTVIIPHSLFREVVEILHEDKMARGDID